MIEGKKDDSEIVEVYNNKCKCGILVHDHTFKKNGMCHDCYKKIMGTKKDNDMRITDNVMEGFNNKPVSLTKQDANAFTTDSVMDTTDNVINKFNDKPVSLVKQDTNAFTMDNVKGLNEVGYGQINSSRFQVINPRPVIDRIGLNITKTDKKTGFCQYNKCGKSIIKTVPWKKFCCEQCRVLSWEENNKK